MSLLSHYLTEIGTHALGPAALVLTGQLAPLAGGGGSWLLAVTQHVSTHRSMRHMRTNIDSARHFLERVEIFGSKESAFPETITTQGIPNTVAQRSSKPDVQRDGEAHFLPVQNLMW